MSEIINNDDKYESTAYLKITLPTINIDMKFEKIIPLWYRPISEFYCDMSMILLKIIKRFGKYLPVKLCDFIVNVGITCVSKSVDHLETVFKGVDIS